jgi:hypothetical protein
MTIRQPPPFAARLLIRLVPAQNHDALLGDLSEEFQRRRSVTWYCLQILAAIVVGAWKDTRAHKLIALRASLVGFASYALTSSATLAIHPGLSHGARIERYLIFQSLFVVSSLFVGWIVVRLHRAHGLTMVFAFKGVWVASLAVVFLWYAILYTSRPEQHVLLPSLAAQFWLGIRSQLGDHFILLLCGGYLATRQPEAA